jgi:uncharacterized protein
MEEFNHDSKTTLNTGELRPIDENAIQVWRMNGFFWLPIYLVPVYIVAFNWWDMENPITMLLLAFLVVFIALYVFAWWLPVLRWKYWRYMLDQNYILLKYGIFFKREIVIPFSRVQLVDTSHGPIMRSYGLMNLSISTAGGDNAIPALPDAEAELLRNHIADQARLHEVDV